ncbi:MAG: GNAT family N-acetyltransferase [Proteobacteria bacterium]|nr:GNAT family N-acetyltransferase [Pseudomonadota bacterium]
MTEAAEDFPAGVRLTVTSAPPAGFQEGLGKAILAFMNRAVPDGAARRVALMLHDAEGALVAGLSGSMQWGWLFVAALWVADDRRGCGLGRALLAHAEAHAAAEGCHSVWLDTFQARGFYERLGYEVFGALDAYPGGQTRSFLRKRIA